MAKIEFIRLYKSEFGGEWADIVYESGRVVTVSQSKIPKTAKKWLEGKEGRKQYDSVYKREETIFD